MNTSADRFVLNGEVTITNNTLGFYKIAANTECYPYLGSNFSSAPIGIDLVVSNSNASVFSTWWLNQQFLQTYSLDPPPEPIDYANLAAQFGPVKCYTRDTSASYAVTNVSDDVQYKVGDDGKIAQNTD
jgi:hypothetical protein